MELLLRSFFYPVIVLALHLLQTLLNHFHDVGILTALVGERLLVIFELALQKLNLLLCRLQFWLVFFFLRLTSLLHRGVQFILRRALHLLQLFTHLLQLSVLLLNLSLEILDLTFDSDA